MPRFDPKDYIEVKDRIVKFWDKYPEGAILTEQLYVDDRCVRFKAAVYAHRNETPHNPIGTGHAEEYRITEADIKRDSRKQYEPNATSAVENCETSAVGRALAMAGFEVSKSVASRQEMEKVARQQKAQEARRAPKEETSAKPLDKPAVPATVDSNGEQPKVETPLLREKEALTLAGKIKETGMEMSAIKLKLTGMGVELSGTLAKTLQTMTPDQGLELYAWVMGEQEKSSEGQTTT